MLFGLMMTAAAVWTVSAAEPKDLSHRVNESATVLKEIHAVPDKDIPQDLWSKAACVMVVPSLKKGAFIVGGEYGKGLMSCRHGQDWSSPVFMKIAKGSWGLQIGGQSIDLVLLVMNEGGAEKMLHNKVNLGAEASVAAGPVGRDTRAATDGQLKAEILAYSRTQGVFAGIDLSGGILSADEDDNKTMYGNASATDILHGSVKAPATVAPFMAALRRSPAPAAQ